MADRRDPEWKFRETIDGVTYLVRGNASLGAIRSAGSSPGPRPAKRAEHSSADNCGVKPPHLGGEWQSDLPNLTPGRLRARVAAWFLTVCANLMRNRNPARAEELYRRA